MCPPRHDKAFALVLVLIVIVLCTTMAVFFLASAGRERRGVDAYAQGSQVQHFAEMAVNRVIGQISAATKEGTAAAPVSWASQPGMVRTYKDSGNPSNVYKLYSWDTAMVGAGSFDPTLAAEMPPAGWKTSPAVFTDLNQPVNNVYPIVDPRAVPDPADPLSGVTGFSIDKDNVAIGGATAAAPMPAKWLYVLEDGQMVAPDNVSGMTATISGSPAASATNAIIGRAAFWTDDETSKVNINTASEGAFWDWPKAASHDEMQFAGNPPVAGEYNRFPGHPAMTSLSAVFPALDPGYRWANLTDPTNYRKKMKSILDSIPRVTWSDTSSRAGTYPFQNFYTNYIQDGTDVAAVAMLPIPSAPIQPDTDRLFASSDELLFRVDSAGVRSIDPNFTSTTVQQRRFFLTSSSRAPETTLFETPRISLWPVTWPFQSAHYTAKPNRQEAPYIAKTPADPIEGNTWMRAEERLLAFVSTLNKQGTENRYYFQRQNPDNPTADYGIQRNIDVLKYLRGLTDKNIPGYGGSFASKYAGQTRDFILANTFGAVRSSVNQYTLIDSGTTKGRLLYSFTPVSFYQYKAASAASSPSTFIEANAFEATPLRIDLGSGPVTTLSEYPKLREVAMVFFATKRAVPPTLKPGITATVDINNPYNWDNLINTDPTLSGLNPADAATVKPNTYPIGCRTTEMKMALILDFSPTSGTTRNSNPRFWVRIITGSAPTVNATRILKDGATLFDFSDFGRFDEMPPYIRPMVERYPSNDPTNPNGAKQVKTFDNTTASATNYAFISDGIATIPAPDVRFTLGKGSITVELYALKNGNVTDVPTAADTNLLIDRYEVDLSSWGGDHPTPLMPYWQYFDKANASQKCPNPLFDSVNYTSTPADDTKLNTRWALTEIPGKYYGVVQDYGLGANPSGYTTNYPSNYRVKAGTASVPADGSIDYATYLGSPTPIHYAARMHDPLSTDPTVTIPAMTDFKQRVNLWMAAMDGSPGFGAKPAGTDFLSENSLIPMATYAGVGMYASGGLPITTAMDTILSVVSDPTKSGNGDLRLASQFKFNRVDSVLGSGAFIRMPLTYLDAPRLNYQWHTLGADAPSHTGVPHHLTYSLLGKGELTSSPPKMMGVNDQTYIYGGVPPIPKSTFLGYGSATTGTFPLSSLASKGSVGDWASGPGFNPDGSIVPRLDQDFQVLAKESGAGAGPSIPYFRYINSGANGLVAANANGYFSPNREVTSPVAILGNLPSSMTKGWQTLLFDPNPDFSGPTSHPGLANPPDHLLLDLFWMPVAEPYPISDQFSTAGKINLNYQIMPFTYIHRKTGLYALLKSTWITALKPSLTEDYKSIFYMQMYHTGTEEQTRYRIDVDATLKQMDDEKFAGKDIYRSGSEICSLTLVPADQNPALTYQTTRSSFWPSQILTSDTAREEPYDNLYSRVTTRSNTYTVHWKAQVLRKVPSGDPKVWTEGRDVIASELRGSTIIERYLDPNAVNIPDYATDPAPASLGGYYKWHVLSERLFQP